MIRRLCRHLLLAALVIIAALAPARAAEATPRPNIVIILADDLGIECLSSYGGTSHRTPNIDQLASQGMRFTRCFSNPYCSPSRASLLTGRYPFKNGLKTVLHSRTQEDLYLHPDQPSFARQLKQAGYATVLAGKWHVSLLHKHNTITAFGFDQYQSWQIFDDQGRKTTRYHHPYLIRNGTVIADQVKERYGPEVDMEFLLGFMRSNAAKKQPFLAYLTTVLPHYPWEPTPDSKDKDKNYRQPDPDHKGDPKYFPDMVAYLDKNVGRVMQTLEELGIANDTIVFFLADNGTDTGIVNLWGDGVKVRGGKGTLTDRGTHVPLIVRWPGHVQAGATCDDLIDFSDFLPTLCDLGQAPQPAEEIHGRSFAPQLLGKPGNPREWIHIQHEGKRQVRNRDYMLDHKGRLQRVVALGEQPPEARDREKEAAARKSLQAVFDALGN